MNCRYGSILLMIKSASLRASAGDVVAEVTTGDDGTATTDELYLGRYLIVEAEAPYGYSINPEVMEVTLVELPVVPEVVEVDFVVLSVDFDE